jgi:two-component system response regulator
MQILMVDDNEDDIDLALRALRETGITEEVFVCRDGEEALDYLFSRGRFAGKPQSELPRLVLLDLKLPKINGLEVLKEIRASPTLATLPVVMLTSSSRRSDLESAYKSGANSYLIKSTDFGRFKRDIEQMGRYWLGVNQA